MKETWESRINRAEALAAEKPASRELLTFYAVLLRCQKDIYQYLRRQSRLPSGAVEQDLVILLPVLPSLLKTVESNGPPQLAGEAREMLEGGEPAIAAKLIQYWHEPSDVQFFGKAFSQPYASRLAEIGASPRDGSAESGQNRCPFCGGKPQVGILQIKDASSESGGRDLVCATCLTSWPFARVVCASCGEHDPAKIGYYQATEYDHIRLEACDSCKSYIKTVDLTRYGLAVPLVDEVAAGPLDVWARERGYEKIELNLLGL